MRKSVPLADCKYRYIVYPFVKDCFIYYTMRKLQNKPPFLVGEFSVQTVPVATGALHSQADISWSFLDRGSLMLELFHQHWLIPSQACQLNRGKTVNSKGQFCLSDGPVVQYKLYTMLQGLITSRQSFPFLYGSTCKRSCGWQLGWLRPSCLPALQSLWY